MQAPVHDHAGGTFEHRAVVYDDVDQVVGEVARLVEADLDEDRAVLLCVAEPVASGVRHQMAEPERVHFLDLADRYTRPIDAMNVLWRFTREQLDAGASRVHSIGELAFTGSPSDDDWFWYEASCSEVLDDLALTATCLYGTQRCPESALAMVRATHDVVELNGGSLPEVHAVPSLSRVPPAVPDRRPDVELPALSLSHPLREVLRQADSISPDVFDRACLVFSELVANAVRHGDGVADVALWFDGGGVVGRVRDQGPGIQDPFATMRHPRFEERGVGLWLSHIESTRLVVESDGPGGTMVTALIAPA